MAERIIVSKKFSLQLRDYLKGLGIAVVTSTLTALQGVFESGVLKIEWKTILAVAIGAFIAYVGKNFFAPPSVRTVYKTNNTAKEVAKTITESNETA